MNTEAPRGLTISLRFLGKGRFEATLWADGDKADAVMKSERIVTAEDSVELQMAGSGGAAMVIKLR
jgi:alpha-glucosidase